MKQRNGFGNCYVKIPNFKSKSGNLRASCLDVYLRMLLMTLTDGSSWGCLPILLMGVGWTSVDCENPTLTPAMKAKHHM